ncbi:MAG: hypothetical protein NXI16_10465 [Alphaproteobacteria bacterium]|nr:hypothetical protein [Alphaproteobacteria bacterium]
MTPSTLFPLPQESVTRFLIAFFGILGVYAGLAKLGSPDIGLQGVVTAVALIGFAGYAVFRNTARVPEFRRS